MDLQTYKEIKYFEELDQYLYPSMPLGTQASFSKSEEMILVPSYHGNIAIFDVQDPNLIYVKEHP